MRSNFMNSPLLSLIMFVAVFSHCLDAQEVPRPETCDVSFFNATTASAPIFLDWSGRNAFPDGLASGRSMGPLMIPAVDAVIEANLEGYVSAKGNLKLAREHKTTVVFYEALPEQAQTNDAESPRLLIFQTRLKPAEPPPKSYEWPAIYLGNSPSVEVSVNGQRAVLTKGQTAMLAAGKNAIDIRQGERQIASVSVDEPVDYLIVLYDEGTKVKGGIVYR